MISIGHPSSTSNYRMLARGFPSMQTSGVSSWESEPCYWSILGLLFFSVEESTSGEEEPYEQDTR